MKIGFYGNANNYSFMLARAIQRLGHEVDFIVASRERLHRPEHRYSHVSFPYPEWILDASHRFRWHCLIPGLGRSTVLDRLNACDAVILNEEGPALAAHLTVPYGVLLTGSDIEVFANPELADTLKAQAFDHPRWVRELTRRAVPTSIIARKLVEPQRAGIRSALFVAFLPRGLVPTADRLLKEIGVGVTQRLELQFTDCELAPFVTPPSRAVVRIFSATRLTWIDRQAEGLVALDLKGSDVMLRGLAKFIRESGAPIEIHLVRKGRHVDESIALAAELGLAPHITWHDEMSQIDLLRHFQQADIVLEQFGSSVVGIAGLDAMATGRPLIAHGRPEIFEPLIGETSPICQARTSEEIVNQLKRLVPSPAERARVGAASRRYVELHFSADSAAAACLARMNPRTASR